MVYLIQSLTLSKHCDSSRQRDHFITQLVLDTRQIIYLFESFPSFKNCCHFSHLLSLRKLIASASSISSRPLSRFLSCSTEIFSMYRPDLLAFLLPLLAAPAYAAETLDCAKIRADGHTFDLSKLGGPHSIVTTRLVPNPPEHYNTTYTLDICKPLKKSGDNKPGECPNGTRGTYRADDDGKLY